LRLPFPERDYALILEIGTKWLNEFSPSSKALQTIVPKVLYNLESVNDATVLAKWKDSLYERFGEFDCWFEKILQNHLIFKDFPINYRFGTYEDYFFGIFSGYFFAKFVAICYMADKTEKSDLADVFSLLYRLIGHTNFEFNAYVLLKQAGLNSLDKIKTLML
jgi:hypothetical protein